MAANLDDIAYALKAADAAGDTQGAGVLAEAYRNALAQQTPQATDSQKYLANPMVRLAKGLKDPIDAFAQLIPRGLHNITSAYGLAPDNPVANYFKGQYQSVDKDIADSEKEYAAAQKAAGTGFDAMRLGGNVLSPANAIGGKILPRPSSLSVPQLAYTGAVAGGYGAASQPVTSGDNFGAQKAGQATVGALSGAVLSPIIGKVVGAVVPRLSQAIGGKTNARMSVEQIDSAIDSVLQDAGTDPGTLGPDIRDQMRREINRALLASPRLDPASAMRQADFQKLGMRGTLGQVTRDPAQFANEKNMRGVANVGEPLLARFGDQERNMSNVMGSYSKGALPPDIAGEKFTKVLSSFDEMLRGKIGSQYAAAEASSGVKADVPLAGLSQDYARIMDRYGESNIPGAIKSKFAALGIDPANPSNQKRVFSIGDAEQLLQDINKLDPRHTNPPVSSALGEVRGAIKNALIQTGEGDVFGPARAGAKLRFDLQDAIPALKAAANGDIAPEQFVNRFIERGKVGEVKTLAALLKKQNPDAFEEARVQLGKVLERAAYGENQAGDKAFSPERFAKTLRDLGPKLSAFYTPDEVARLHTLARVGAYKNSVPADAAVNFSNNSGWAMNALGMLPKVGGILKTLGGVATRDKAVRAALEAAPPQLPLALDPQAEAQIRGLLGPASLGAGLFGASTFR